MLRVWLPLDGCGAGDLEEKTLGTKEVKRVWWDRELGVTGVGGKMDENAEGSGGGSGSAGANITGEPRCYELVETRPGGTRVWRMMQEQDVEVEVESVAEAFPVALRVGEWIVEPANGEPFVWDHSYRHGAWNYGSSTRIVLIVDIWHPELTDCEIKFLSALQQAKLRYGRALVQKMEEANMEGSDSTADKMSDTNFISLVEKTKGLLHEDDWWVLKAERNGA
eukprot:g19715.t1